MKTVIQKLKEQIQAELREQAEKELSIDGLALNQDLAETWLTLDDVWCRLDGYKPEEKPEESPMDKRLTADQIKAWNDGMINSDGTIGAHWSVAQTTELAKSLGVCFEHINAEEWNVACNMVYSDYVLVMRKLGQDNAPAYGYLAKAFLFDVDGGTPAEKLARYYCWIVKAAK